MILSPKWQQTYEEALQAMKDTTYSQYSLADVSTHHHTEELLEAALRNNRCSLRDIPVEKRTLRLCHVALECCHSINVQYIPKKYFDYNFSLKAASYCHIEYDSLFLPRWAVEGTLHSRRHTYHCRGSLSGWSWTSPSQPIPQ